MEDNIDGLRHRAALFFGAEEVLGLFGGDASVVELGLQRGCPRPLMGLGDEVVFDWVCECVGDFVEDSLWVGELDSAGLFWVPEVLPLATVGIEAACEKGVEIAQEAGVQTVWVGEHGVDMIAHGQGGMKLEVVLFGAVSEDVPEGVDGKLVGLELEGAARAAAREEDGFAR